MSNLLSLRQVAIEVSRKSNAKYFRHGAILIRKGRVVSSGYNDETTHAEVNAIKNLERLLPGQTGRKERQ